MEVLVAGGHGQIALRLLKLLADHGHRGRGLIRNPDHAADLEAVGADPVLCDLESDDPRPHVGSAEAIVFAAGAGPGSGPERKRTVDLGAAVKLIEAAQELGVARYVMVSAMGTHDVQNAGAMRPYLEAKKEADDALIASGLDWTIVRPGRLTDGPGPAPSTPLGRSAAAGRSPATTPRSCCSRRWCGRAWRAWRSTCSRGRRRSARRWTRSEGMPAGDSLAC